MKNRICCIFNLAPLYNKAIYTLMDKELNCDFYIGDKVSSSIELMQYDSLIGFKKVLKYRHIIGDFHWQKGSLSTLFKSYEHYILTGDPHSISSWIILLLNKIYGRKTYLWTHGWYGNEAGLKKLIKKIFFSLSYKILLYGDYARNLMINEGFNPKKLISIYNSLDYNVQLKIRENLTETLIYKNHFKNQYPVLIYIGRIQNRKKIDLLIIALNELQKRKIFCNLVIIGKQSEEINLDKMVKSYRLEKSVWFFGPCYNENIIGELIYNANLCVVPGDVGLTVMHSFIFGTPVITHNNFSKHGPEFEAIESNITGDFFIEDSIEDLCDKIIKWISNDVELKMKIRQKCYQVMQVKYNPNKQIEILRNMFSN